MAAGKMLLYDPKMNKWKAPGDSPQVYAVYVDNKDIVWLSDFGSNATLLIPNATTPDRTS
ncbi:MAG: hypothetical protein HY942_00635 [Gammaproteobacteria bacterium]|nr:hypothetical protein [Gammaproteobacteria bacterium]